MELLMLSRIQFAITTIFHFLFVPVTLGLSILIAFFEWRYVFSRKEIYKTLAKFWGKLFLINFAIGVLTGIALEFEIGMNFAEFSRFVGDVFGAPLAIEATLAFFLESVFIGLWAFGGSRISDKIRATSITFVAFASNISAFWIILANGWMQNPAGYNIVNNRVEMTDFFALISNQYAWIEFFHTLTAAFTLSAFFVMAISAYHILKRNLPEVFVISFKVGAYFGLISSLLLIILGDISGTSVAKYQPAKFAAMESMWETKTSAPMYLFVIPDEKNEKNYVEFLGIPKLLSFLAYHDFNAKVRGLKEYQVDERPSVPLVHFSFRIMVGIGFLLFISAIFASYYSYRNTIERRTWLLKWLFIALPLCYLSIQLGWIVTEVGRQPWIVYGLLKTKDAISKNLSQSNVFFSLLSFLLIYTTVGLLGFYLIIKNAFKGVNKL